MQTSASPERQQEVADTVILRAEAITKLYAGTVALNDVNFNVYRGKINVLIGENGAGKSTLMKILAGAESATAGTLLLDGQPIQIKSPRDAARHGIGIIYQELSLFPNLSVAENIFMTRERTQNGIVIDSKKQRAETQKLLQRLEQAIDPRTLVSELRIGQQQIVEIARALAQDVRILIMDEPTSALTTTEVEVLFRIMQELKEHGVSIIYISHKLEELLSIGDYVTVLRDSKFVAEAPVSAVDVNWIVSRMVGHDSHVTYEYQERPSGAELLKVEELTLPRVGGGKLLDAVSFSLRAGEILGVYGLLGAGRTELLECLMGLRPTATGAIWLDGKRVAGKTVTERIAQGLALIPEDRQREGVIPPLSIINNMTLASLPKYRQWFSLSSKKERSAVQQLIRDLSIRVSSPQALITSLSGGNQQKVLIGRAILNSPRILLMDEPTRGIDIGAKADIFKIMNQLAAEGLGILFVSSELREVVAVADRILVLAKGQMTGEFTHAEATEEALVAASSVGQKRAEQEFQRDQEERRGEQANG